MRKVSVITGGGSGMGLAAAEILGKEGYHVLLVGRNAHKLHTALTKLQADGISADIFRCDITNEKNVQELAVYAASQGFIESVIHAAGMSPHMGSAEQIMQANALGTIYINRTFYDIMESGSCIVDTASTSAYLAPSLIMPKHVYRLSFHDDNTFYKKMMKRVYLFPKNLRTGVAYSISKHFVIWYAKACALQYGQKGIRVISITPGNFETPMGNLESAQAQAYLRYNALPRMGKAEEIGALYASVTNPSMSYLTGCDILCDGGCIAGKTLHIR